MASDDMRMYETFFGIHTDHWSVDFGDRFSGHHKLLVKEYINEACSTTTMSTATLTQEFLYPHHIKKKYWVEGVIEGHFTLAASGAEATVTKYKVSLRKLHKTDAGIDEDIATTGWITVSDTLAWDAGYSVGNERVYHYWIDCWEEKVVSDQERLYLRIEVDCDTDTVLWHSNDSTWEDVKITIPFRL